MIAQASRSGVQVIGPIVPHENAYSHPCMQINKTATKMTGGGCLGEIGEGDSVNRPYIGLSLQATNQAG